MELKPCPFCGSEAELIEIPDEETCVGIISKSTSYMVVCTSPACLLSVDMDNVMERGAWIGAGYATDLWNTRADCEENKKSDKTVAIGG
jgi:hypothetical protein